MSYERETTTGGMPKGMTKGMTERMTKGMTKLGDGRDIWLKIY